MKRIICMVLAVMLALSCAGAFAAERTVYGSTTGKVDVELSVTLKNYYTWVIPGDDHNMAEGIVYWGDVGLKTAKFSAASYVYLYVASANDFNLVHETVETSKIPYVMSVEEVADVRDLDPAVMGGKKAYLIMKTRETGGILKKCYYEMAEEKPLDCGWYKDTVTFYCNVK